MNCEVDKRGAALMSIRSRPPENRATEPGRSHGLYAQSMLVGDRWLFKYATHSVPLRSLLNERTPIILNFGIQYSIQPLLMAWLAP